MLQATNIPYTLNEDYAKLIREQTDWFDNFKPSRDDKYKEFYADFGGEDPIG